MPLRVSLERGQIDDGELGNKACKLRALGPDQELANEQRVPGKLREHAHLDAVSRIRAAVKILCKERLAARMGKKVLQQLLEVRRGDLAVAVPPHRTFGQVIDDGVLVLGGAPGMDARLGAKRPSFDNSGLAGSDRMLVEHRRGMIPVHGAKTGEAEFVGPAAAVPQAGFLHDFLHKSPAPGRTYALVL